VKQFKGVKQFTWPQLDLCFVRILQPAERDMNYQGFQIETFEAGKGLWHARIRRADFEPVIIDGVSFPELEVGFAWTSREAAISDAKTRINYLNQRSVIVEQDRFASHV
jgi:hypothetical protein